MRVINRGTVWSLDDEAGRRLSSGFSPDRCWVLSLSPRLEPKVWSVSEGPQNTAVQYQHWPNTRLVEANSTAATSTSQMRASGDVIQGPHVKGLVPRVELLGSCGRTFKN